tara:strand:- start:190 stop:405 length:216 start_codon:yes stop_codon:yes gene_type:complete
MKYVSEYTLDDVLKDTTDIKDKEVLHEYIESFVKIMRYHYEKEEFDNEIIKRSQSKDMAVMDYIIEAYKVN